MDTQVATVNVALVKSFPNDPVVRCVLNENTDWVELCMEDEFNQWVKAGVKPLAVRCPKSRVFSYEPDLYARLTEAAYRLGDNQLLNILWSQAKKYYREEE